MRNLNIKNWGKLTIALSLSAALFMTGTFAAPAQTVQAASAADATTTKAQNIISTAKRYIHTPYKFGARVGNTSSFDCSSFVATMYKKYGVNLPRSSKQQSKVGRYVPKSQLKPGDLVFFYSPIHHVGIYIGNGKIIHTFGKPGVTISDINSGWWSKHYTTARRVL